jgi:dTDP-4-dehydrorhamnose 3,5-epimerase
LRRRDELRLKGQPYQSISDSRTKRLSTIRNHGHAMEIRDLAIPDVKLVVPEFLRDHRGYFSEIYNRELLQEAGIDAEFDRDNISLSRRRGTVRGLHCQIPPHAADKLVRVQQGRIFDVAVDIRHGSPHFGRHVAIELDAEAGRQIFVPRGFAHGFCTLEPDTIVAYKAGGSYHPELDEGILWHDPGLAIDWPIATADAVTSERDRNLPRLADAPAWFRYP